MSRPHWIRESNKTRTAIVTHCGLTGTRNWRDRQSQFDAPGGKVIEAVTGLDSVECGRCLKSAQRIAEGLPRKGSKLGHNCDTSGKI